MRILDQPKPFNLGQYQQFQDWLSCYGAVEFSHQKQAVFQLLEQGDHGAQFEPGQNRLLRIATRVAIRQFDCLHPEQGDLIQHWRQRFDRALEEVVTES